MTRVMIRAVDQTFIATRFRFTPRESTLLPFLRSRFPSRARLLLGTLSCNSRERKRHSSLFAFPPLIFYVCVCVNINISVALALALSSSARASSRSISLTHPLSFFHSLPPFLSLPFSPPTVSSSGEETHPRLPILTLNPLLVERALIFIFL